LRIEECVTRNELWSPSRQDRVWDDLVLDRQIKDRVLHHALLSILHRPHLRFEVTALHGVVTLYGPPGTGKTTLARGLPAEMVEYVDGHHVRLLEVNPHGLMSSEHGQSQQRVNQLLAEHVPALADDGMPTVVLLDEIESMTVARSAASLSANPADVHRATDAVLTALDTNAAAHPHLLVVATSNFTDSLDEAFLSRSDVAILVPMPGPEAIARILSATLLGFGERYPALTKLAESEALTRVAAGLAGVDARRARKFVTETMARSIQTVVDPSTLTAADLLTAAEDYAISVSSRAAGGRGAAA
jgi:SpoVK/Ycf46/Vps4 family AAA+-type ATPase